MTQGEATPSLRQATNAALAGYARRQRPEGIRTPVTQHRGRNARMNALEKVFGEKAAAAAAGVTPRTWKRWRETDAKPRATSLAGLQGAYDRLLDDQTLRRLSSGRHRARVSVTAEIQWSGYYNGQADKSQPSGPAIEEFPPDADNNQAHRELNLTGPKGDTVNIGPLYRAYRAGRDTGEELERMVNRYFDMPVRKGQREIFPNTYHRGALVIIGKDPE